MTKSLASAAGLTSPQLREARRFAVQFVYQCDVTQQTFFQENGLKIFLEQFAVPGDQHAFVRDLVRATIENMSDLDARIEQVSRNWKLSRIAKVDLAVLRVCAQELLAREDVGLEVIISDAAEIGKQYGSSASGGFVNGVLDAIAKQARSKPARSE
ncbi:MAG: transcription antitermination factor NusB [Silvanigrellales bacterium]|nr:transcription antitermination factor NusB [Silvanigrellales bacterium]